MNLSLSNQVLKFFFSLFTLSFWCSIIKIHLRKLASFLETVTWGTDKVARGRNDINIIFLKNLLKGSWKIYTELTINVQFLFFFLWILCFLFCFLNKLWAWQCLDVGFRGPAARQSFKGGSAMTSVNDRRLWNRGEKRQILLYYKLE